MRATGSHRVELGEREAGHELVAWWVAFVPRRNSGAKPAHLKTDTSKLPAGAQSTPGRQRENIQQGTRPRLPLSPSLDPSHPQRLPHVGRAGVRLEEAGDANGVLLLLLDPDVQGLDSSKQQPRVERAKAGALRVLEEVDLFTSPRAHAREKAQVLRTSMSNQGGSARPTWNLGDGAIYVVLGKKSVLQSRHVDGTE